MIDNNQLVEGNVSDMMLSIVIMSLLFIVYSLLSVIMPDDYIYFDIAIAIIYTSGIIYLYNKNPIILDTDFFKPSFIKYTIIGVIVITALYLQYYFRIKHDVAPEVFTSLYNYNAFGKTSYLIISCIIIPANEEILFRRYYYNILKKRYGVLLGAIISIALFAGAHGFQSINIFNILLQGVIYTYIYEKSASIWSSFIVHSFNNSMWFLVTYIAVVQ